MAWMIPAMIGGAALGAVKNIEAANAAADERKRQAEITKYSPWTGMMGRTVQDPSMVGDIIAGTAAGASMGQNIDKTLTDDTTDMIGQEGAGGFTQMSKDGQYMPAAHGSMKTMPDAGLDLSSSSDQALGMGMSKSPYTMMDNQFSPGRMNSPYLSMFRFS